MIKDIFVDIETFGGKEPDVSELKVPGNITKQDSIDKWLADPQNLDDEWRKRALDSMLGKIVCIGVAFDDEKPQYFCNLTDEHALMHVWVRYMENAMGTQEHWCSNWVAHNGMAFDFPWIWHRIKKYGLTDIMPQPKSPQYKDTMKMMGFTDYKAMYSLDKIGKFWGIGGKGDVSGKDVHDMVLAGKTKEIGEYCASDVSKLISIYRVIT